MKLVDQPRLELLYKQTNLIIPCDKADFSSIKQVLDNLGQIDYDKDYEVKIERKKVKRSLDANAYLWVLINKLGAKLYKSDLDIYREYIKDSGVFQVIPVREDAIEHWKKIWGIRGDGWICEDIGPCKNIAGYHNIKSYYGTSVYDTQQMSRIIDAVVQDCKDQGIDTMTPDDLSKLKAMWGEKDGKP